MSDRPELIMWREPYWARIERMRRSMREAGVFGLSLWAKWIAVVAAFAAATAVAAALAPDVPVRTVVPIIALATMIVPVIIVLMCAMDPLLRIVMVTDRHILAPSAGWAPFGVRDPIDAHIDDSDPRGPRLVIRFDPRRAGKRAKRSGKKEDTIFIGLSPRVDREALKSLLGALLADSRERGEDADPEPGD